ncbi:MAG: hypothetical protein JW937_06700 [Candidatus Omnitrophica bacterium]|nr:hypothetical protein [Candidatus Omnitrophota bacterium]
MKILVAVAVTVVITYVFLLFVQVPVLAILFLGTIAFCAVFWVFPKSSVFFFLIFMLFQGPIAYFAKAGVVYNLEELGIVLMAVLVAVKKLVLRKPFYRSGVDLPLLSLVLIGTVSSFVYRIVPPVVAFGGLVLFLKGFLLFYIFLNLDLEEDDIRKFKTWFYMLGIFTVLYGVLAGIWPGIFLAAVGSVPYTRFGMPALQAYLGHPGSFSALMGVLFCFAFADRLSRKSPKSTLLVVIFLAGIILSLRRTTFLGVLCGSVCVLLSKQVRQKLQKETSVKILGIVLAVCVLFSGLIVVLYRDLAVSYLTSESPRSMLFQAGVQGAADHFPLGSGFGTFSGGMGQKFYSPLFYKYRLSSTWGLSKANPGFINDTFWPHIIAETGVFGFLCYAGIIWALFRVCFRALRVFRSETGMGLAIAAFMLLVLSLVESTKAPFYEMALWTFFYFGSVGVLQSWMSKQRSSDEDPAGQ